MITCPFNYILGAHKPERLGITVLDKHTKLEHKHMCTDGYVIKYYF